MTSLALGLSLGSSLLMGAGGVVEPDVPEFNISVRGGTSGFAPAGFMFIPIYSYAGLPDSAAVNLHHVWDFGDVAENFAAVSLPSPMLNSRNLMIGHVGAHVFENPGAYTVTCRVYNAAGVLVARGTADVTVESRESYFGASNTIVYSEAGDFSDAPAAAHLITNVSDLYDQLVDWNRRNRVQVLIRRGDVITLDAPGGGSLHLNDNANGGYIGPFGDPADPMPEIRLDGPTNDIATRAVEFGSGKLGPQQRYVIEGCRLNGRYDPVTPNYAAGVRPMNAIVFRGEHGLAHKCEIVGAHIGVQALVSSDQLETMVSECTISDWSDYGVLFGSLRSAIIGSSIKQNPNVAFGSLPATKGLSDNFFADHGPIRCSGDNGDGTNNSHLQVTYGNDLFSKGGWSSIGPTTGHQPCLRLLGSANSIFRVNVNNNRMEGGLEVMTLSTHAGGGYFRGLGLVEHNLLIGDGQTSGFIRAGRLGIDMRSNVFVKPDVPQEFGTLDRFFIWEQPPTNNPAPQTGWPVRFYNNTCVNLQSSANAGPLAIQVSRLSGAAPPELVVGDNLLKADGAPNAGSLVDYDDLDPAEFYRPLANSAALGASGLGIAPTDFARTPRNGPTAVGAWHDDA